MKEDMTYRRFDFGSIPDFFESRSVEKSRVCWPEIATLSSILGVDKGTNSALQWMTVTPGLAKFLRLAVGAINNRG